MSDYCEMEGSLSQIKEKQTFNSGFYKQEFILSKEDGKYPQEIKFELLKDKVELLSVFKEGDEVSVRFDIRGSEYKGRHYVNLVAFSVTSLRDGDRDATASQPATGAYAADDAGASYDDDLPL